jgi:GNAT superfamily N-acetyltransferase
LYSNYTGGYLPKIERTWTLVDGSKRLAEFREMLLEYAAGLGFDLCFQDFDKEIAGLPGAYAEPEGAILMAVVGNAAAGCVALKPLSGCACEMKRLYVRPGLRKMGMGKALAEAILEMGARKGYTVMRLDTLETMTEARLLYERLGFVRCDPYTFNPFPEAVYMEKRLGG